MTDMINLLKIAEQLDETQPMLVTTRKFRRNETLGMVVWRTDTINLDNGNEIEHIEIACPGFELTVSGPVRIS